MDVPSTFRVRPTASNRRRGLRLVTDDDDPSKSDEEVVTEEVVEDHPQAQDQHGQPEVRQRTSIADSSRTGENPGGGPTSLSLLPSFRTHIAFSIWQQQERPPLKCQSHAQKISEWAWNAEGRQNTVFNGLIGRSGLAPLVETSYHFINRNVVSAFVER